METEEKAKRYDELLLKLQKAKVDDNVCDEMYYRVIDNIVPELKESEDENIRKTLIDFFNRGAENGAQTNGVCDKDIIAWLEKQGEIDKASYEIAEKEKQKFVGDGFIKCHANFQDFKEGSTYWLEYIGNDNYNVRSDNLLGKTYHITPCQLYTIFKKQTYLEKQGEQIKPIFEVGDVMRTKEEATKGLKSGMPIVVSIDKEYYHCNNEIIAIKNQYDYEYPPMNKKPAWCEEDAKHLNDIIEFGAHDRLTPNDIDWLNSLRNRVQPKPNQKWSEEDKKIIDRIESEFLALYRGDYKNIDFNDVDSLTVLIWVRKLKHLCF